MKAAWLAVFALAGAAAWSGAARPALANTTSNPLDGIVDYNSVVYPGERNPRIQALQRKIEAFRVKFDLNRLYLEDVDTSHFLQALSAVKSQEYQDSALEIYARLAQELRGLGAPRLSCADWGHSRAFPQCEPADKDTKGCCTYSKRWNGYKDKQDILSCYYYACAAKAYNRDLGCDKLQGTGNYLVNYGLKYCNAFYNVTYDLVSPQARWWLARTMQCLQRAIVAITKEYSPLSCSAISDQAFRSHVDCYVSSGLCDLPLLDQVIIAGTVDSKDLVGAAALQQASDAGRLCVDKWKKGPFGGTVLEKLIQSAFPKLDLVAEFER